MTPLHPIHPRPPTARPTGRRPLGPGERVALRLRHGIGLGRQISRFAAEQRLWWLVPVATVMAIFALALTTTTSALPVAVYALF